MKRITPIFALMIAAGVIAWDKSPLDAATAGAHDYFLSLTARPDHWKSYSLRDQKQLTMYKNSNSAPISVNYTFPNDPDAHQQDAAKVVIPAISYVTRGGLASPIGATDTVLTMSTWSSDFYAGRAAKVDNEVVAITAVNSTAKTLTVERGRYGTTAAAHNSGAGAKLNTNSLENQVRLPIATEEGHSYLFTWDVYWTDSYVGSGLANHKTFQFSNSTDSLWLEAQTRYAGDYSTGFDKSTELASLTLRSYNTLGGQANYASNPAGAFVGPTVTKVDPILPMAASFKIRPNRWVRQWVRLDLRAGDYDIMDYWVAEDDQNPVQIYKQIPLSVGTIAKFWLEFNTSQDRFVRSSMRDLVSYVRNFVVLRDTPVSDIQALLVRPVGGIDTPAPPQNLRRVP